MHKGLSPEWARERLLWTHRTHRGLLVWLSQVLVPSGKKGCEAQEVTQFLKDPEPRRNPSVYSEAFLSRASINFECLATNVRFGTENITFKNYLKIILRKGFLRIISLRLCASKLRKKEKGK